MLKNKLLLAGVIAGFSLTTCALADTLTLTNATTSPVLFVKCNNSVFLPVVPSVHYYNIISMFPRNNAHPNQYQCVFNSVFGEIGTATLRLTPGNPPATAQILSYAPTPPNRVSITPANAVSQAVTDITVTLSA